MTEISCRGPIVNMVGQQGLASCSDILISITRTFIWICTVVNSSILCRDISIIDNTETKAYDVFLVLLIIL